MGIVLEAARAKSVTFKYYLFITETNLVETAKLFKEL